MCSSTDSFDSSLVLKDSGSSSTSPSRLPKMLVENQPANPICRALNPGARIAFINVCPVLKSFPQFGASLFGQVHLVLTLLHVTAVELLHVIAVEKRRPWTNRAQEWLCLVQQFALQYA